MEVDLATAEVMAQIPDFEMVDAIKIVEAAAVTGWDHPVMEMIHPVMETKVDVISHQADMVMIVKATGALEAMKVVAAVAATILMNNI